MSAEKSDDKQPSKWPWVRFLAYWRDNIKTAKEHHEGLILLAVIGWQFVYIGLRIAGIDNVKYEVPHLDEIEHVSVYVFAAVALLWIPFRRHESTSKNHKGEMDAVKQKLADAEQRLAGKANARQVKDQLGQFIKELEDRINQIGPASQADYVKRLKEVGGGLHDVDALGAILFIYNYIKENVGKAEAEVFNSTAELNANNSLDRLMALTGNPAERERIYVLHRLQMHVRQLKPIIEKLH